MGIMESLGRAAGEIGNAADQAVNTVKAKYEEKVTPEKRQEIQDKFDKGAETVVKAADKLGEGFQHFIDGFNETNGKGSDQ